MKSWKVLSIAGLVVSTLVAWSGSGQARDGSFIDQRGAAQEQRIQDGLRSGALTPREAGRLAAEQQRIRDAEARLRADDGRLNPNEKAIIDQMQNKAGRDIYRETHDRQAAYPRHGHGNDGYQRRMAERHKWQRYHGRHGWRY